MELLEQIVKWAFMGLMLWYFIFRVIPMLWRETKR